MTTLVYDKGVIAYDSRATVGDTIVDDNYNKRVVSAGVSFFMVGYVADLADLISYYMTGIGERGDLDCSALVVDNGNLAIIHVEDGVLYKSHLDPKRPYALGSGQDHAWTALDCGCTPVQAVRMAAKRDVNTGGRIRKFNIKTGVK